MPIAVLQRGDPHPMARGIPPSWASGWGQDEYAPWVSITAGECSQRLRWIPPGLFLMGSPNEEAGRNADVAPQREMTIGRGFWMFATPCTQGCWEDVMRENPSRFRSPDRPVEQVSWDDCQEFVARLNARLEGLELSLPSEAQWEYACRAGTRAPRYGEELSEIAWYAENSGGQTQPVGLKRPNGWGLYDMLGNVLEWCMDDYHGRGAPAASAVCVVRGGSWVRGAWYVRAAYRFGLGPGLRDGNLGFRCAEFREGQVEW